MKTMQARKWHGGRAAAVTLDDGATALKVLVERGPMKVRRVFGNHPYHWRSTVTRTGVWCYTAGAGPRDSFQLVARRALRAMRDRGVEPVS